MKKILFTSSEEYQALENKASMLDKIMAQVAQAQGIEASAVTLEMLSDYFEAVSNQEEDGDTIASFQTQIDDMTSQNGTLTSEIATLKASLQTKIDRISELEKLSGAPTVVPVPSGDVNPTSSDDPYLAIANNTTMNDGDRLAAIRKIRENQ